MNGIQKIYDNTKQLSDALYTNTAESYASVPDYINQLQNFMESLLDLNKSKNKIQLETQLETQDGDQGCDQNEKICADIFAVAQSLVTAYQQMSTISMADILKGNLLPLIQLAAERNQIDLKLTGQHAPQTGRSANEDKIDIADKSDIAVRSDIADESYIADGVPVISEEWKQKNIDSIPQIKNAMFPELEKFLDNIDENDETITLDLQGSIAVLNGDQWWNVNSTVDSKYAAEVWGKAQAGFKDNDIVILCGMSNCSYIRKIVESLSKDNVLVVYEPDARIFAANFIYTDMRDLLSMDNCFFLVDGLNMNLHDSILSGLIGYNMIKYTKFTALPGYDVAYQEKIANFMDKSKKTFESLEMLNNTILQKNENVNYNVIMNLRFMMMDSTVDELKKAFEKKFGKDGVSNIPAIIVAAGPSLDKNIMYLKDAKNKALIIAVDSALRMLMKYDIMPDLLVTLDPNKERVLFEDDRVNDIPVLYSVHGTYDILEKNRSRKFVYCNMSFINQLYAKLGYEISNIDPGGSVANAGFAMAKYLGYRTIIMIGQDLAFTNNKKHASVVYQDKEIGTEGDVYTTVEGINGEELQTYVNFKAYRDWYENIIEFDPELNFINATEGGAKIHGATHMMLKDAIAQYCSKEVDFKEMIDNAAPAFSMEQRKEFAKQIKGYIDDCENIWRTARNLINYYDQMMTLRDDSKLAKLAKKADVLVSSLENEPVMEFISYYSRAEEMNATSDLYDEDNQDIRSICKNLGERGKKVAVSYEKNSKQTRELFEKSYEQLCSILDQA